MDITQIPSEESLKKTEKTIRAYVDKYRNKTGTTGHPDPVAEESVIAGLVKNMQEVGRPLCPCNFYPDKQKELDENGRRWVCACDEMKQYKYCHCLLFVRADGMPITEYLPEDHDGRIIYGVQSDPTPDKGREGKPKNDGT